MKKIGCGFVILGMAVLAISVLLVVFAVKQAMEENEVVSVPIEVGGSTTTETLDVNTDQLCKVAVEISLHTDAVREVTDDSDNVEYKGQYEFPFSYRVMDADGTEILVKRTQIAWDEGSTFSTSSDASPDGADLTVEHSFETFSVELPGKIKVEAELEPDTTFEAQAGEVKLIVYDNVSGGGTACAGLSMFCFGPVLIFFGAILFIIGLVTSQPTDVRRAPPSDDTFARPPSDDAYGR